MGMEDGYELTPDHHIGIVSLPGLVLEVRPKIPMSVSYACEAVSWFDAQPEFSSDTELSEIIAIILARMVEHATRRGLLNGYLHEEESLQAPRGRIPFDEQIRRRLGMTPPVEVRHDVFSADILENRVLLASLTAIGRVASTRVARRELVGAKRLLGAVKSVRFSPSSVPEVRFTRLNRHYRAAIALATLVLRSASLDLGVGGAFGSAFLLDMNVIFERFVRRALRSPNICCC
ncbi:MAG: hypothetical protein H0U13_15980 [Gemmatimonadaceae bacterium]|nr:hypothetical protein [Gemmatimonadaceae bacterium]